MNKDLILSRLIKEYLIAHPNSTGRQICEHFAIHDFGLRYSLNANTIFRLIQKYNTAYRWFNIEATRKGSGYRYICK